MRCGPGVCSGGRCASRSQPRERWEKARRQMRNAMDSSIQQQYVRLREVQGEILCLWAPLSPTRRAYRMVLEVTPINFLFKAEEEQAALLGRYSALLKSL